MSPLTVSAALFTLWAISWGLAAVWSRRTTARPAIGGQIAYLVPTVIGALLLVPAMRFRLTGFDPLGFAAPLWTLPSWAGWLMTACVAGGVAFMWWARLTLGDLWSGNVTRKEGHELVERGPYRLVRHPIYTGLILVLLAIAIELGAPVAFAGLAFFILGFWLKARLEERFLINGLGEEAYTAYRKRTPMLIPFWPLR